MLLDEVISALAPREGQRFLDGTFGGGGHTLALLEAGGAVFATDADGQAVDRSEQLNSLKQYKQEGRLRVEQCWLDQAAAAARDAGWTPLDGVLADLGLSSFQLDEAARGFAFRQDGPLDMRFDRSRGEPASLWLERCDVSDLTRVLRDYGEVQQPRRLAEAIWAARPVNTTAQLRAVVEAASAANVRSGRIHPATQVFQALRIAVNDELRRLSDALPLLIDALKPGGRIAVIAFHSLEDRIVKNTFRELSRTITAQPGFGDQQTRAASLRVLTKDPITPGVRETERNPRARSAKLRVAERV